MAEVYAPVIAEVPRGTESCEHCRAVAWAGETACLCEFSRLDHDWALVGGRYAAQPDSALTEVWDTDQIS
jgi:hypothetical protein